MTNLIAASAVPPLPADGARLIAAADVLAAAGRGVGTGVQDASAVWSGLPQVYDAPETSTAVAAITPVVRAASDFDEASGAAARALRQLGETFVELARLRDVLVDDVAVHRTRVLDHRASDAAAHEDPADPLSGWGFGGFARNQELLDRCASLARLFDAALEQCERDLGRIGDPYGFASVIEAGASMPAASVGASEQSAHFHTELGIIVLGRLTSLDQNGIVMLLQRHPEWVSLLRESPPHPAAIAQWWSGLDATTSSALTEAAARVVGGLGGVPATVRAEANRTLAHSRLAWIEAEIRRIERDGYGTSSTLPYAHEAAVAQYLRRLAVLRGERDYLDRVVSGDAHLYLYDPDHGAIIEMFGDPADADVILSFMPGTNTTMESFYESTAGSGITALARWQVNNPDPAVTVAGFVVKQGEFPQLSADILRTGPQNNDMMESLGRAYADFTGEVNVIAPDLPIVSVEHSAGSAAGGAAEVAGASFAARVPLAGIGMTAEWVRQPGTDYYAMQAPNDINKNFDGIEVGNWGYAITPTAENGFAELETGLPGTSPLVAVAAPISPTVALSIEAANQVENHNRIMSGDMTLNGTVLRRIQQILRQEAIEHD
ncbi:hypothetical protein GCM10022200_28570 [Microbacterium awajiense]|uniref:Uncharacterized protein n=1 Tax=Microbacterium awajiense TaxID=415214 RepID=A0ABP7AYP9_9MICO